MIKLYIKELYKKIIGNNKIVNNIYKQYFLCKEKKYIIYWYKFRYNKYKYIYIII
jgi:hypothetical protein